MYSALPGDRARIVAVCNSIFDFGGSNLAVFLKQTAYSETYFSSWADAECAPARAA